MTATDPPGRPNETVRVNKPLLMTRKEIEADYGISVRWLELAAHRGDGPPMVKLSRRMCRYRRDDFEAWLAKHTIDNSDA